MAVVVQARGVEVQAVVRAVRIAFFFDGGDGRNLLADVVGGSAPDVGRAHVEPFELFLEVRGVALGDFPRRQAGAPRAGLHLVLAGVRVRGQVPHVGDVDDVMDFIAAVFEGAPQDVFEDIGAQVADVLVVVHGRAAGVQADLGRCERCKGALLAGIGIKKMQGHKSIKEGLVARCGNGERASL